MSKRMRRRRSYFDFMDMTIDVMDWPVKLMVTTDWEKLAIYIGDHLAEDVKKRIRAGVDANFTPLASKIQQQENPPLQRTGTLLKSIKYVPEWGIVAAAGKRPVRQSRFSRESRTAHNAALDARIAALPKSQGGRARARALKRRKLKVYKELTAKQAPKAVSARARSNWGLMMIHSTGIYSKRGLVGKAKEQAMAKEQPKDIMGAQTAWTRNRKRQLVVAYLRKTESAGKGLVAVEKSTSRKLGKGAA